MADKFLDLTGLEYYTRQTRVKNDARYPILDNNTKIPANYLPSYVDDVLEFPNKAGFPVAGETGKIYVAIDTNIVYRWSGTAYVEISVSLALGITSSTAYRGDYGHIAYTHAGTKGNPHDTAYADIKGKPTAITDAEINGIFVPVGI